MVLNSNMAHVRIKYHVQFFSFFGVSEFYSLFTKENGFHAQSNANLLIDMMLHKPIRVLSVRPIRL